MIWEVPLAYRNKFFGGYVNGKWRSYVTNVLSKVTAMLAIYCKTRFTPLVTARNIHSL